MHSNLGASPGSDGRSIVAQAPCRVDLAGSTLDLWPLYLFHPGAVTVNYAVPIMTTCKITPQAGKSIHLRSLDHKREEHFADLTALCKARKYKHALALKLIKHFQPESGFVLETNSESPPGAGIAASSAMMIATTAALAKFTGRKLSLEQMRVLAQNIEAQLIRVPTGCQDYYPALYGGVGAIHLTVEGIQRELLQVPQEQINSQFLLVYTGMPRHSGFNNWEVFKSHIAWDKKVVKNFGHISAISHAMHKALLKLDWDEVARLIREDWKLRRSNYDRISTPLIDKLIAVAAKSGGRAAKVCGAGGGGCVVFMVKDGARERVIEALRMNGGQVMPSNLCIQGLTVSGARAAAGA